MRCLMLVLMALPLAAQVRALYQPVSLGVSDAALGKSGLGMWTVSVILPPGSTVTRQSILMAAPELRALPNRQAIAILARGAFKDRRSALLRVVQGVASLAPSGIAAGGIASGSREAVLVGFGASLLVATVPALKARAPDPAILAADDLLPDVIAHTGTWYVLASLTHGAHSIGPLEIK